MRATPCVTAPIQWLTGNPVVVYDVAGCGRSIATPPPAAANAYHLAKYAAFP